MLLPSAFVCLLCCRLAQKRTLEGNWAHLRMLDTHHAAKLTVCGSTKENSAEGNCCIMLDIRAEY